ncbi:MAG: ABC transporter permease [Lachnospiraceae bacterium]|nr:ABC transporter permease [Lachnospiraceae bacterium]MBP5254199.1 ABC transporter permease [Lachnospiraceae bacterium]
MKEPLFHIVKRDAVPWWQAWLVRIGAVVAAILACALVTVLLTGQNPVDVLLTMADGAAGTPRRLWALAQNTAILLCIALAVTPAFKMRFWNTGAEGQVLAGALSTAACMIFLTRFFTVENADGTVSAAGNVWLLYVIMIAAAILSGALWGVIPAFFKAKWNTNETLFTLMMNYVIIQIINYFAYQWSVPKGSGAIGIINLDSKIGWFAELFGQTYLINILIVVGLTVALAVYLRFSKHGYEIAVVGESENTARYIGINVKKVIIRTMILSGAICGIAGLLLVAGTDHTVSRETAGGRGFTAIMVSWMAKFDPLVMVLTSFLIVFLQKGAGEISTQLGLNKSFSDILTGIIILFIIGCEFFINYRILFNFGKKTSGKEVKTL